MKIKQEEKREKKMVICCLFVGWFVCLIFLIASIGFVGCFVVYHFHSNFIPSINLFVFY